MQTMSVAFHSRGVVLTWIRGDDGAAFSTSPSRIASVTGCRQHAQNEWSSSVIPAEWRLLYSLNPMVGVNDGFRWCLLGGESTFYWPGFAMSLVLIALFLWICVRQVRSMEKTFADLI